jgi:PAS domain S-box-containing protein
MNNPRQQTMPGPNNPIPGCDNNEHSNFLLQVFLNNTDSSVILTDRKFQVVFYNKLADQWSSAFVGKPLYKGMPIIELASDDRKESQLQLMTMAMHDKHFELEYEIAGDNYVCFLNSYFPAKDDQGEIIGVLVTSRDITERKRKEEELKISNERYQLIAQATSDAIWDFDLAKKNVFHNESFTRHFGHRASGKENGYDIWERNLHPEDRERVLAKVNAAVAGSESHWEDEYRFITSNGEIAYVYDRGMIIRNEAGEPVRMIGSMQDVTKQKHNELGIALSEHRFRSLVQSGTDLIGILDEQGNYSYVSPTVKQLGYDQDFLIGKNAFDFIHPADLEEVSKQFEAMFTEQQVAIAPFRFRDAQNNWRWVETVATNMIDDPAIKGIVVNSRDITEKKQKDEDLQRALNDLNKILDSSVDVIVVTDKENRFVKVSAAAELVWGYRPEELVGKTCLDLVHPEDLEHTSSVTEKVMKGAKITNFQNRYIRKDGSVVPLIWSARWDRNEDVMYAIARDASEKIEAEVALKKSEAMFRTITESFPNGIVAILDKDLKFEYVAGKELENVGLSPSYFVGTVYNKHFPENEHEIKANAEKVFSGETVVSELKFVNRNYIVSSVPLYEVDGTIPRILVVAQNITTQKKTQKEKELLIVELTKNIHDLRQFSYITSHNLRAPISNLIGIMSLINMDTIKDADTHFLVQKFKESTYLLNDTVNDLLNILLIKNNVNVKKETFSLQQVWQAVCTSVSSQVKKADAKIVSDFTGDDNIVFNKSYAESILLNLLTNSLKYRDKNRQLVVEVSAATENDYVVISFRDNGIGINLAHHRDKIFGLYQRFHNYPDSKGLGLYIVHSQITALGGKIEVESEANKGTCFKLYFKR